MKYNSMLIQKHMTADWVGLFYLVFCSSKRDFHDEQNLIHFLACTKLIFVWLSKILKDSRNEKTHYIDLYVPLKRYH